jgi:hypothetical protein
MRAKRAEQAMSNGDGSPDRPPTEPGRVRQGLEAWLADQVSEPEQLVVEAARALADEVDRSPRNSPLWGRLLALYETLLAPVRQAAAWGDEVERLYAEVALSRANEEWRVEQYRAAVERGDDPSGWERVVPIGCARGRHSWVNLTCQYCREPR